MKHLINKTIELDGDTFRIIGVGFVDGGRVYLHLASTTRFRAQRNGKSPIQVADWFPLDLVQHI